eukprot:1187817-Prorocentrum_minimum.AAC.2
MRRGLVELEFRFHHYRDSCILTDYKLVRVCPCAEKLGAAFYPAKADLSGNIEVRALLVDLHIVGHGMAMHLAFTLHHMRLAQRAASDPEGFKLLFSIPLKEVEKGEANGSASASKGLLWLKSTHSGYFATIRHYG